MTKRKYNKIEVLTKKKKKSEHRVKYANPRMKKFISELALGKKLVDAGLAAGYSESYCKTRLHSMVLHSPTFHRLVESMAESKVDLIRNLYRVNLLPRTFKCDGELLSKIEAEPELGLKYPQVLNRVHKIAGTLQDEAPQVQFVNIKALVNVQNYFEIQEQQHHNQGLIDRDDEIVVEGEIVELEGSKHKFDNIKH